MSDDHRRLHSSSRLRERREVRGAYREKDFVPSIAFLFHGELVVHVGGAAADTVEGYADNLTAWDDSL